MMPVSHSTASLSRHRPIILTLTGTLVAYGVYALYTVWRNGQQTSLRRQNAVRRPHASRASFRLRRNNVQGTNETELQQGHLIDEEARSSPALYGDVLSVENELLQDIGSLGILIIRGNAGEDIPITLTVDTLPTAHELCNNFGLTDVDAENARAYIEGFFITQYLERLLPRDAVPQIDVQEREFLIEWFRLKGLRPNIIRQSFESFANSRQENPRGQNGRVSSERDDTITDTSRAQSPTYNNGIGNVYTRHRRQARLQQADPNHLDGRGNNLKSMLYYIAEDQAKQDGYIHRGVSCDSCDVKPIRGIRWRCANCPDYDLCSDCEAVNDHPVTHIFYKVKVPAHFLGNPKQAEPILYPGKPELLPDRLPPKSKKRLIDESRYDAAEVEALWEQFRCLANVSWAEDPNHLGAAIDRDAFDKSFVPHLCTNRPAPNLIYDRMFAFYDSNHDDLIGFEEFVKGLSNLHSRDRKVKLRQVFDGYDVDGDGYVSRKDFLRMFRAYYAIQKEITRDLIALQEEQLAQNGALALIHSGQPLSAAFSDLIPSTERRVPSGKPLNSHGDAQVSQMGVVLDSSDDLGDRRDIIGNGISKHLRFRSTSNDSSDGPETNVEQVPTGLADSERGISQVINYNHSDSDIPLAESIESEPNHLEEDERLEISNPEALSYQPLAVNISNDRFRNSLEAADSTNNLETLSEDGQPHQDHDAIRQRWQRRHFYVDEEEGFEFPLEAIEAAKVKDEARALHIDSKAKGLHDLSDDLSTKDQQREPDHAVNVDLQSKINESAQLALSDSFSVNTSVANKKSQTEQSDNTFHHSRSSSKGRFEDDLDNETRSNTSVSSRPVDECLGEYEIPEAELDIGREILYQVTQQALNELLDPLFKEKEDMAMQVWETKNLRRQLRKSIRTFCKRKKIGKYINTDLTRQRLLKADLSAKDKCIDDPLTESSKTFSCTSSLRSNHAGEIAGQRICEAADSQEIHGFSCTAADRGLNAETLSSNHPAAEQRNATESALDSSILTMPLHQLLKLSGYTVKEGEPGEMPLVNLYSETPTFECIIPFPTNDRDVSRNSEQTQNDEGSVSTDLPKDPTLPQNRPNSSSDPDMSQIRLGTPSSLGKEHHEYLQSTTSRAVYMGRDKSKAGLQEKRSSCHHPPPQSSPSSQILDPPQPSEALLARLALLDAQDKEIKERNGPGRISFEEFIKIFQDDHCGDLAFVEGWLEMASF